MRNGCVLCISAGMLRPKKSDNAVARLHLYLNYGLLGLASVLAQRGYEPLVVHGRFDDPDKFVEALANDGRLETRYPVLLSVPSSQALGWARDACRALKRMAPRLSIVVGGRWVVARDGLWIRSKLPEVDLVVYGTAEDRIEALLDTKQWREIGSTDLTAAAASEFSGMMPPLEYRLLERYREYNPSVEVSRGCGRHCSFCAEADVPRSPMKDPTRLADELTACWEAYGKEIIHPYFESSLFLPSTDWIVRVRREFEERGRIFQWRAESRVDGFSTTQIAELALAGLKVIDLGLESASHRQLVAMNKSPRPATYLRRASELLQACYDDGIWTKVNILLYPGETQDTLDETVEWLDERRKYVKGVSVGPMILYRDGSASLLQAIAQQGASIVDPDALEAEGFVDLHLSKEMPHDAAVAAALTVSRRFMTARDYFDLKSFSYLPRGLSWEAFSATVARSSNDLFSFSI